MKYLEDRLRIVLLQIISSHLMTYTWLERGRNELVAEPFARTECKGSMLLCFSEKATYRNDLKMATISSERLMLMTSLRGPFKISDSQKREDVGCWFGKAGREVIQVREAVLPRLQRFRESCASTTLVLSSFRSGYNFGMPSRIASSKSHS